MEEDTIFNFSWDGVPDHYEEECRQLERELGIQHTTIATPQTPIRMEMVETTDVIDLTNTQDEQSDISNTTPIQSQCIGPDQQLIDTTVDIIPEEVLRIQPTTFEYEQLKPDLAHNASNKKITRCSWEDVITKMRMSKYKVQPTNSHEHFSSPIDSNAFSKSVQIFHYLQSDDALRHIIFSECQEYRSQIIILYNILPPSYRNDALGGVFGVNKGSIATQLKHYKKECSGNQCSPGRKSQIDDSVVNSVKILLSQQSQTTQYLTMKAIQQFVNQKCGKAVSYNAIYYMLINRLKYKFVPVSVDEDGRIKASLDKILSFYNRLKTTYNCSIKSSLFMNLDEMGCNGSEKHGRKYVMVPTDFPKNYVRVSDADDSSKTSTLLSCVSLAGQRVSTAVVVDKAFAFYETLKYFPDVKHYFSESGFVTQEIFELFVQFQLVPAVKSIRSKHDFPENEPCIVLLDNASVHISANVKRIAAENHIFFEFLVEHTSHVCQPLDISIFGTTKATMAQNRAVYTSESSINNVMNTFVFNDVDDKSLDNIKKVDEIVNDVITCYPFISLPSNVKHHLQRFRSILASETSVSKCLDDINQWFNDEFHLFPTKYRQYQSEFIQHLLNSAQSTTTNATHINPGDQFIANAIALSQQDFKSKFDTIVTLLNNYKQSICQLNLNEQYLSNQLLHNDTFNMFEQLKTRTTRREDYEYISDKLMKILNAYEKATFSSSIINSFEGVGIISLFHGGHWKVVIDISTAKKLHTFFPEVVHHPSYSFLTHRPSIQKAYLQVVIPKSEVRKRMEDHSKRMRLNVVDTEVKDIIRHLQQRTKESIAQQLQLTSEYARTHAPRSTVQSSSTPSSVSSRRSDSNVPSRGRGGRVVSSLGRDNNSTDNQNGIRCVGRPRGRGGQGVLLFQRRQPPN